MYDDRILLLIYAYEWFGIPPNYIYDKVCYHPYLNKIDFKRLNEIYEHEKNICLLSNIPFFTLIFLSYKRYGKGGSFRKNKRLLLTSAFGAVAYPYMLWKYLFAQRMNRHIIDDPNLNKYLNLDIDKEKIKNDLLNFNIVLK